MQHSTIAAIATAPGAGGIAIVRLSAFSDRASLPSRSSLTAFSWSAAFQLSPTSFQLLSTCGSMVPPLTVRMYSPSSSRMPPTSPRTSISSSLGSSSPSLKMSA